MQRLVDAWAREALARLQAGPDVRRVGLALTEGGGRRLRFAASDRDNDDGVDWCHVDAYQDVPLNTAVASGLPVVGTLAQLADRYEAFVAGQPAGVTAIAAVPIQAAGQVLGGFVVFSSGSTGDADELVALGVELGARLRLAQLRRERLHPSLADAPVAPGARAETLLVPHDPGAVRQARHAVQAVLAGWGLEEDLAATAVLCLSELVTNALIHATTDCEVALVLEQGVLTTTVRDGGGTMTGPNPTDDPFRVHGRGLQVVDALASRWGSDLDEVGTTVWFVLET